MIGQHNVILSGGTRRALLFPIDAIDGPSPSQYCLAVQDVESGLIFNSVCKTIDPAKNVTEDSVKNDFRVMVMANGGAAVLGTPPGYRGESAKPEPEPQPVPPAPERTAPPRKR